MGRYEGKNVVVAGGSSGLGLATAELLVAEGARVLITGRTAQTLEGARERLGPAAIAVESDAASIDEIASLAERVGADFEQIHAVFANVGINGFEPFESTGVDLYEELFRINTRAPYFIVQALAPMLAPGSGIVFTTSVAGVKGLPMLSAYGASKAALRSMTRSLARELVDRGIRVNAVSPGPIDTGILEKAMSTDAANELKRQMADSNPMSRLGDPAEVAKAVVFLAFEATYTTGAELTVDGGGSQL